MDDKDFNWMYDTDILDSFVEGEHYSVGRWGMNTHTGYEYCGRSTSKADSTLGEEQLLFLMCVHTSGRPGYFVFTVGYLREKMEEFGVTVDDLRQHTGKKDVHI